MKQKRITIFHKKSAANNMEESVFNRYSVGHHKDTTDRERLNSSYCYLLQGNIVK